MAADVFISYSSRDRAQALDLARRLEGSGVTVWIDQAGIGGARLWSAAIVDAIEACRTVVLLVSATSIASPHVVKEVSLASEAGKSILPLYLEQVALPNTLRYQLTGIHHLELFRLGPEEAFAAIRRALAPAEPAYGEPQASAPEAPKRPSPGNLPRQLTRFIGRERDKEAVATALAQAPLLTLTGSGGTGKTRLALEVADERRRDYPDGAWLVELAPLADPDLVPQAVADALGVRDAQAAAPRPVEAMLAEHLRARRLMLILDNCEHLQEACARLADALLRACPTLQLLTTSRVPLRVPGEVLYPVPPLACPDSAALPADAPVDPAALVAYEAVRLFVERATAVQPAFRFTSENGRAVAQICRRLDGIPLALELAAVRIRALPAAQIAARLDDRFRLLTGGSPVLLPRQQTLEALIDWSYDLLSEPERTLFRRLSVFAGGWTLPAAESICGSDGVLESWSVGEPDSPTAILQHSNTPTLHSADVLDRLTALVEQSLVLMDDGECEPRYRMLETVREYGRQKVRRCVTGHAGEEAAVVACHAAWFLQLAEQAAPALRGPEQAGWLSRLDQERENLRLALQSFLDTGAAEPALRLAAALWRYWHIRGYAQEGRGRLAAVLALPGGAAAPPSLRAQALNAAGALAHDQAEVDAAAAFHREALALACAHGDRAIEAEALNHLGNVAVEHTDRAEATACYEAALAIWRSLGDDHGIAMPLNNLGYLALQHGDPAAASGFFTESLVLTRRMGNRKGAAIALSNLGYLAEQQGDHDRAALLVEEALALFRELGDSAGIAEALHNLGHGALQSGEPSRAAACLSESLAIWARLENRSEIAVALEGLAAARALEERSAEAARFAGAAAALREAAGFPPAPEEHACAMAAARAAAAAAHPPADAGWEPAWNEGRSLSLAALLRLAAGDEAPEERLAWEP